MSIGKLPHSLKRLPFDISKHYKDAIMVTNATGSRVSFGCKSQTHILAIPTFRLTKSAYFNTIHIVSNIRPTPKIAKRRDVMDKIEEIAEGALQVIVENITDHVFLLIQEDRVLMQQYIEQVIASDKDTVNRKIGKYIKNRLNLTNIGREEVPESSLIASYEKHGLPK